jgi:hypothetical protein
MPKDEKEQQTEKTPTGYKVPVPKRRDFFGNLRKAAKPERAEKDPAPPHGDPLNSGLPPEPTES